MEHEPATVAIPSPRVGDEVRYEGGPATVARVHPQGASWLPSHLVMPVDLQVQRGHLAHRTTMTPYGPNGGWSWPEHSEAAGEPRDDA